MWPRPRPESWGTAAPQAATSGARTSETLSPTPPVECLSTVGRDSPREVEPLARVDHRGGPRRELARRAGRSRATAMSSAATCSSATLTADVGVEDPADLGVGELGVVALGADDVDDVVVVRRRGHRARRAASSSASKAPGSSSPKVTGVAARRPRRARRSGPPCSSRTWRHRPHGASGWPSPAVTLTATSGPCPPATSARHEPALRAQREPVGGVLDVARGHDRAVRGETGGAHVQPRVRARARAPRRHRRRARSARTSRQSSLPARRAPSGANTTLRGSWNPPAHAIVVADEVRDALDAGRGVVALETTLLVHGLPPEDATRVGAALGERRSRARRGPRDRRHGRRRRRRRPRPRRGTTARRAS